MDWNLDNKKGFMGIMFMYLAFVHVPTVILISWEHISNESGDISRWFRYTPS